MKNIWTDSTEGPIQFLTHHPTEKQLILGTGNDILLFEHSASQDHKTACRGGRQLPSPPPFPGFPGDLPESTGRSAQFMHDKGVVVVSYLHHGVV